MVVEIPVKGPFAASLQSAAHLDVTGRNGSPRCRGDKQGLSSHNPLESSKLPIAH